MEERRNSNVGFAVLITVLVMLVLGMGGFIIYDKVINKTNEPNIEENDRVDDDKHTAYTDYDLNEAKKLVDKYYVFYGDGTSFDNMSNKDKNAIAFAQTNNRDLKKVSCKSLYGKDFYELGDSVLGCDSNTNVIDYNVLNNEYHKLFGENKNASAEGFNGDGYFDYVTKTNQFAKLDCMGSCGTPFEILAAYDVLSAKMDDNNNLIVTVGYDSFSFDTDREIYVSSYDNSSTIDQSFDLDNNYIKQNLNKVYKLTLTFKKENNDFFLITFSKS